jgi:branched-chain amino acid transport system permease protein
VLRGALSGSVYALLAAPMSLLFVTARTVDFAIGAYALLAAAIGATIGGSLGMAAGLSAALGCAGVMAAVFLALRRLGCEDGIVFALASFGMSAAISSLVLWRWGAKSFMIDSDVAFWSLGGIRIAQQGVFNLLLTALMVVGLDVIIRHTNLGRMMRASAVNAIGAALAAIPVEAIQAGVYLAGGCLGGLAGLLVLYSAGVDFTAPLPVRRPCHGRRAGVGLGVSLRGRRRDHAVRLHPSGAVVRALRRGSARREAHVNFWARRRNTLLVALGAALVLPFVTRNAASTDSAVLLGVYALIALSVGLSYGQAGVLTLSQGAFASLGAYAAAICTTKLDWPPAADLAPAIAAPALLAYGVARLVARLSPLATALSTLAVGSILAIVIRSSDSITGGYMGIAGVPSVGPIATPVAYAWLSWGMVALTVLLYENLCRSAYGRALRVVRLDQARAAADGVDPPALIGAAFAISAGVAGAAGWLYAHYISFVSPDSLDAQLSISALLMATVGGAGFVLGPIFGALLLDGLARFLPAAELQGFYYGAALIAILLVARRGLIGLGEDVLTRILRLRPSAPPMQAQGSRP